MFPTIWRRTALHLPSRYFATSSKPPANLVSLLRKQTNAPLSKIIKALSHSNNSIPAALDWLSHDALASGTAKAAKLDRVAAEGVIYSITPSTLIKGRGVRGILVEVNSETDFAIRGPLFQAFVKRAAVTGVMFGESLAGVVGFGSTTCLHDVDARRLLDAPAFPLPDSPAIEDNTPLKDLLATLIGTIGERVTLRRACIALPPPRIAASDPLTIVSSYIHTLPGSDMGRMGAMVVLAAREAVHKTGNVDGGVVDEIERFGKRLAQHVTGFNPLTVDGLLEQEFLFGGGMVKDVVAEMEVAKGVRVEVVDFVRYECGEGIEKVEKNFAEEVQKQLE
ncbi:hypothetical protein SmJEL517_g02600 [Synchytrium microbalum]|uniref:Elongation factor Ts, mitochondrial n=1 Tax=Synchytrium microbalum TaxID=1806994 RepID=A0A507C5U9_9FUNG|nr:uncharacterized protein SmJEL517_g02600 [Synchytrium microbalum]TPX34881.1 hypothetical protein SmJEL517_g02600 [Synchytrium microbalum]